MKAKSMRSFAVGLLVAAGVCSLVYFIDPDEATSTQQKVVQPTVDEMKSLLTSEGYVIHTDEEWEEQLAATKAVDDKNKEAKKEETKEKIIYRAILNVSSGMTSIDIGEALERAKIIDKKMNFFNEVEKRGLAKDLRPGTYEVESGMTIDEVISTIYK
ncbi:hypothetical protein [Lederbergia lenta]|uniref:Aminodeoxychorismate lyase n=1 Tax=Lederbergia lenta TaxID=1467 RepID=A0A2X4WFG2_LEDLE|nr:hypothetical protein [Lederbergia lenta]MCM3113031.1 endolytic transglycosylase MltG [Lederbergia lenta]MEC2322757.1 hypothetical protein [Lederbergia lenta]SQI61793.1 aminodeoxychorismate lyase [Lederbergia lenta]